MLCDVFMQETESLNSTTAQLQDELHSTNQELNRVRAELKATFKESYSLKEVYILNIFQMLDKV